MFDFVCQSCFYKWNFLHHDKRHVLTSEIYFRDMYYIYERRPATPCRSGNNRTATLALSLYSMCRFAGENADVEPLFFSGQCRHRQMSPSQDHHDGVCNTSRSTSYSRVCFQVLRPTSFVCNRNLSIVTSKQPAVPQAKQEMRPATGLKTTSPTARCCPVSMAFPGLIILEPNCMLRTLSTCW